MNQRLRLILLTIGLLTVVALLIVMFPKLLGFYYQVEGGQQLESSLNAVEDIPDLDIICAAIPRERNSQKAKVDKAVTLLEQALAQDPRNAQANIQLGRAYCLLGDPATATKYFQTYIRLKPKNPLGHIGLGFANEALGKSALAVESWKTAGLNAAYFLEMGKKAFQAKRFEDALRWFERSTWIGPEQAQSWLSLGEAYNQLGQSEQALQAYQAAWDIDPALAATSLTAILKNQGEDQTVEKLLFLALEKYPGNADRLVWWRELALSLRVQQKWDEAAEVYNQAILEFPNQEDFYIGLGIVYFNRGDGLDVAKQEIERAISLNEQSGVAYYELARLHSRAGKYSDADILFEQAVQRAPQNRWYMLTWADNSRLSGKLEQAINQYQKIITRFPDFGNAYFQLALAFRAAGQTTGALDAIERGLELKDPLSDTDLVTAGEIYQWSGKTTEAIRAYRQALVLNPNNLKAINGLEALGAE